MAGWRKNYIDAAEKKKRNRPTRNPHTWADRTRNPHPPSRSKNSYGLGTSNAPNPNAAHRPFQNGRRAWPPKKSIRDPRHLPVGQRSGQRNPVRTRTYTTSVGVTSQNTSNSSAQMQGSQQPSGFSQYGNDAAQQQIQQNQALGLPHPSDASAFGRRLAAFNNAAYPGTNPWEQLGGGAEAASSGFGSSEQQAALRSQQRLQEQLQRRDLDNRLEVARLQIAGQTTVAEINERATQFAADKSSAVGQRNLDQLSPVRHAEVDEARERIKSIPVERVRTRAQSVLSLIDAQLRSSQLDLNKLNVAIRAYARDIEQAKLSEQQQQRLYGWLVPALNSIKAAFPTYFDTRQKQISILAGFGLVGFAGRFMLRALLARHATKSAASLQAARLSKTSTSRSSSSVYNKDGNLVSRTEGSRLSN